MTQPKPLPRCRVLIDGKPCGQIAAHGIHDPAEGHHPFYLERRVSGERRKLDARCIAEHTDGQLYYYTQDKQHNHYRNRRISDRRKAGKL